MQYYEVDLGGVGLTSDGLNVWLYKVNDKGIKELFEGYSSNITGLSGIMESYKDKTGFKKICQYIESLSEIEERTLESMEDPGFRSMKESYDGYLDSKKGKEKDLPNLDIVCGDFDIMNDGMAIWVEDKRVKGPDKRVGGWYTSYSDMLEEFTKYLMNTIRTTDRKDLKAKAEKVSKTMKDIKQAIAGCEFVM